MAAWYGDNIDPIARHHVALKASLQEADDK
jgi:hypothetical protein